MRHPVGAEQADMANAVAASGNSRAGRSSPAGIRAAAEPAPPSTAGARFAHGFLFCSRVRSVRIVCVGPQPPGVGRFSP